MRRHLQLAAVLLLTAAQAHAQIHAPQITLHKQEKEDLSWLWQYTQPEPHGRESTLIHDTRFKPLLQRHLTAPQTFWGKNQSLPDTILDFLAVPGQVTTNSNRYLIAEGCVQNFCPSRGLLWADLGAAHPLIVFAAIDWVQENKTPDEAGADYTLWVFPSRALDPEHIPAAFTQSIARWTAEPTSGTTIQNITTAILVDPNGQPHQIPPATIGANSITKPQTEPKAKP